jgi:sec-independent protein translocase protein TatB
MKIADLKEEALSYKKQLDDATDELRNFKNIDFDDFDDVSYDEEISKESPKSLASQPKAQDPYAQAPRSLPEENLAKTTQIEGKNETVTFKKKEKTLKVADTEKNINEVKEIKETKGDA